MSQTKERRASLRKQKAAMRERCLEYLEQLKKVLNSKGQSNGTLLNYWEYSFIQGQLFYTLTRNTSDVVSCQVGYKAATIGLDISFPLSCEELMKRFPDIPDNLLQ